MDIICLEASMTTVAGPGLILTLFFITQSVHTQQSAPFFPCALVANLLKMKFGKGMLTKVKGNRIMFLECHWHGNTKI